MFTNDVVCDRLELSNHALYDLVKGILRRFRAKLIEFYIKSTKIEIWSLYKATQWKLSERFKPS